MTSTTHTAGPVPQVEHRHTRAKRVPRPLAWVALVVGLALLAWLVLSERRGLHLWTVVDDATGLKAGTAVTLAGVDVGEIEHVSLTDDQRVRLDVRVDTEHAHRLRGRVDEQCAKGTRANVEQDQAARGGDVHGETQPCEGLRFDLVWKVTRTAVLPIPALTIRPTSGPIVGEGAFVPTVQPPGFGALLATLQDPRVVHELPLELRALVEPVKRAARSGAELSEDVKESPLRTIFGGGGDDDKDKKAKKEKPAVGR